MKPAETRATCFEALNLEPAAWFCARQARLPQPHCSHAGAEAGRLHFFRQLKASLAELASQG